jgi:hypothetical protein
MVESTTAVSCSQLRRGLTSLPPTPLAVKWDLLRVLLRRYQVEPSDESFLHPLVTSSGRVEAMAG